MNTAPGSRLVPAPHRGNFVCIECGATFDTRDQLRLHWKATGEGPKQTEMDAIVLARESIGRGDGRRIPVEED